MDLCNIPAIDLHCHFNHGAKDDTKTNAMYECSIDFLEKERRRLGIRACAMSSFAAVLASNDVYGENELLADIANKDDIIYQWVVLDPRNPKLFKQVELLIKHHKIPVFVLYYTSEGFLTENFSQARRYWQGWMPFAVFLK